MSLAEQLDTIRAGGAKRLPEETRAIMAAQTAALRDSGILDGAPKVADRLPDFALRNTEGDEVSSGELLARGPLVMTFFRGTW